MNAISHQSIAAVIIALSCLDFRAAENRHGEGAKQGKQYTIEQFMKTVRIGGASFSANDKEILFHKNQSGIFNVYEVAVAGGAAKQLTHSTKESTFAVDYLPDGRFLYSYDRGGNENSHLYVLDGGQERDLTPGEKVKAGFLGWNDDKSAFYYMANGRDARFFDVFKIDVKTFN